MNVVNKLSLLSGGLLLSEGAMAHPGHAHAPGLLERIQHAAIGWDQLGLLLLAGAIGLAIYLQRQK